MYSLRLIERLTRVWFIIGGVVFLTFLAFFPLSGHIAYAAEEEETAGPVMLHQTAVVSETQNQNQHRHCHQHGNGNGEGPGGKCTPPPIEIKFVDIVLTKTVTPKQAMPGDTIAYTLQYENVGSEKAYFVGLIDILPLTLVDLSWTPGGFKLFHILTWEIGHLEPGQGGILTITGRIKNNTPLGVIFTNHAILGTTSLDERPYNNFAKASVKVGPTTDPNTDLQVEKYRSGPAQVAAGQPITYTLAFANNSSQPVDIILTDDFPDEVSGVSWDGPCQSGSDSAITCAYDDLSGSGQMTMILTPAATFSGTLLNSATITFAPGMTQTDPYPDNNSDQIGTSVYRPVDLILTGSPAVTETGPTTDTYQVSLAVPPVDTVLVAITPDEQCTVTAPALPLEFTPSDWETARTVTVRAVDDFRAEGAHSCLLTHSTAASSDPAYAGLSDKSLTVAITDDDIPALSLIPGSQSVTEGGPTDTYSLALTSQPAATVTIQITPTDQLDLGAGAGQPVSRLFSPAAWNITQTVTISAVDDALVEGDHTGQISHRAAGDDPDYIGHESSLAIDITDNDIQYTLTGLSQLEEADLTTIAFTITRSGAYTAASSLDLALAGTASLNLDYSLAPSGTLQFAAGQQQRTLSLTVIDDNIDEGVAETIRLALTNATGANSSGTGLVVGSPLTLTLTDDDNAGLAVTGPITVSEPNTAAQFTIALLSQPTAPVTINLITTSQECTLSAYTITLTDTTIAAITVTAVDDDIADGTQSCDIITAPALSNDIYYSGLNPADVIVNVADDDVAAVLVGPISGDTSEIGGTATFTMVLQSQPTANVTVTLVSTDPTEGVVSPTLVSFGPANWSIPQTFTVTGQDDAIDDGLQQYAIQTGHAASPDPVYHDMAVADIAPIYNIDDDTADIIVSTISANTTEAGETATFSILLTTQPLATVTIPLSSTDPTEGAPDQAAVLFSSANWSTTQVITVTGQDDLILDGDIPYTITLGVPLTADPVYSLIDPPEVAAYNLDNDQPAVTLTESEGDTRVGEDGGVDSYRIVLDVEPVEAVTWTVQADGQTTVDPAELIFGPATWSIPQTVTVQAVDDTLLEGDHTGLISQTVAGGGYSSLTLDPVQVAITDNDIDLVITKQVWPMGLVLPGQTIYYTLAYSNANSVGITATGVSITDYMPPALTQVEVMSYTGAVITPTGGPTYQWQVADLPAGAGGTILIQGVVSPTLPAGTSFSNQASITTATRYEITPADNQSELVGSLVTQPQIQFSVLTYTVGEGDGAAPLLITISPAPVLTATVRLTTADGSATGLVDYTPVDRILTFGPGQTSLTVTIPITNDDQIEGDEIVTLGLSQPTAAGLSQPAVATLFIIDTLPEADLAITKTSAWGQEQIVYTIVVSNAGPNDVYGTAVLDPLPAEISNISWRCVATGSAVCGAATGTGDLTQTVDIPLAGRITYILTGTTPILLKEITNTAWITLPAGLTDPNLANNQAIDPAKKTETLTPMCYWSGDQPPPLEGPDLVIEDLSAASADVNIVIKNIGDMTITNAFWVDFYVDPSPEPEHTNQHWWELSSSGAVWAVTADMPPGAVLTLTVNGPYYSAGYSSLNPIPPNTPVWAQVDSVNLNDPDGGVEESDETNNIFGPVISGVPGLQSASLSAADVVLEPHPDKELPPREQPPFKRNKGEDP